jgi:hypothetical protein
MKKLSLIICCTIISLIASAQAYGPYIGANVFAYKSNLFNSDDLRVDSFQEYVLTPGFTGGFDFGYLFENGVSINSGLHIGQANQRYRGGDSTFPFQIEATTNLTQVKIPITIGKQRMDGEHKTVLIYSAGLYYVYNASYSDDLLVDFTDKNTKDVRVTTNKKSKVEKWDIKDTILNSYLMSSRPYTRHGFGAVANLGISYKLKEKLFLNILARGEFQINNLEVTDQITYTNTRANVNNPILPVTRHEFGNYAKYMTRLQQNHNRSGTHPFNLGISIGLRYFLFEFN